MGYYASFDTWIDALRYPAKKKAGGLFRCDLRSFWKRIHVCQTALKRLIDPNKIGVQTDLFMIDTG